ncbi:MAG: hypothetical protein A3F90_07035 [Deltaproteobacteria bacterium RIFCSPLOWO2_12_FULL_60_19]|nr:MAG: hypothetical protein A3F90_07035 [Deltaproteobacteria bacterium RIFCSPLOWO2_12_FULL_60_19]
MAVRIGEFDYDPFILETLTWLSIVRTYLAEVETTIPEAKRRAIKRVSEIAKRQKRDQHTLEYEIEIRESRFDSDFPKLLRYSIVTLLHTIVKTQLIRLAKYLKEEKKLSLRIKDFRGTPIEQAKLYFNKVVNLNVSGDRAWRELRDLAELRNIIVHRGGVRGADEEHQKTVGRLIEKYKRDLRLLGSKDSPDSEVKVSPALCRRFLDTIEQFFHRLFQASGLE